MDEWSASGKLSGFDDGSVPGSLVGSDSDGFIVRWSNVAGPYIWSYGIMAYPVEGLTEFYEVDWFGSCCFSPAPRFDNAFPAVRLTSCWRTRSRISRDRIGSETARERLIAPSRQLRMSNARPRLSAFSSDGNRPAVNIKLRLTRAVVSRLCQVCAA